MRKFLHWLAGHKWEEITRTIHISYYNTPFVRQWLKCSICNKMQCKVILKESENGIDSNVGDLYQKYNVKEQMEKLKK